MKKWSLLLASIVFSLGSYSQKLQRPKLVVGVVIDQMRWDYLYRYYERYQPNGAFKRLLSQGFSCENTFIPYIPTVTAPGHSTIFTGSVPAITGITANTWWDYEKNKTVYCTDDDSVKTVGSNSRAGQMSPRNMFTTTICDELRLATNFRSKVIGITLKDRGSILSAGHSANAAYWFDNSNGNWITSTYYMNDLPQWVKDFNKQKLVDQYFQQGWNTIYPIHTYIQSTEDIQSYEIKKFGADAKGFPYDLKRFIGNNYEMLRETPYGDLLTIAFAEAAVIHEKLGADEITDFLTISFSSPDYIGHTFGPNSIEEEDTYLRLDKELAKFLDFLDAKIGKGQYLLFLSADHGVAHNATFLKENKIPSGGADLARISTAINTLLKNKYNQTRLSYGIYNSQVCLNRALIDSLHLNIEDIKKDILDFLAVQPTVARAFDLSKLEQTTLNEKIKTFTANGYFPKRSGDIQIIVYPQWMESINTAGAKHSSPYNYDTHIPLIWYGWNIKPGKMYRETYMTDIAPTVAALLHIQMPSGSVGKVIAEVIK
jgi:predicted AlkP superfamily pyrophosphatase or phosphodiesterase